MTQRIPTERTGEHPAERLDVADGVARLLGDAVLFARVLRRFRDDYAGGAAAIGVAIDGGDSARAHRLAHTLAGAAGMIGARDVYHHAHALEVALGRGGSVVAELDAVGAALEALMPVIDAAQEAQPAADVTEAAPNRALVAELAQLLDSGDGAAIDLLETARAPLLATLGAAHLRAVESAALEFDFERALTALLGSGKGAAGAG